MNNINNVWTTTYGLLSLRYVISIFFLRRSIWHGEVKMATTTMVVSPLATQSAPKNKRRLFAEARQNSLQKLSIIFDHGLKNSKSSLPCNILSKTQTKCAIITTYSLNLLMSILSWWLAHLPIWNDRYLKDIAKNIVCRNCILYTLCRYLYLNKTVLIF